MARSWKTAAPLPTRSGAPESAGRRSLAVSVLLVLGIVVAAASPQAELGPRLENEPLRVAVASNFRAAFEEAAANYGADIEPAYGSSGLLYAQIVQGRPFDVFLSADTARPQALAEAGRVGAPAVYAIGRLALLVNGGEPGADWLATAESVALANPETAPYGRAAVETMAGLDVGARQVVAMNVAQAFHFAASGAVEGAFVAFAHVLAQDVPAERYWVVPASWHSPIEQAVAAVKGGNETAAEAFIAHLLGAEAQARIRAAGYR